MKYVKRVKKYIENKSISYAKYSNSVIKKYSNVNSIILFSNINFSNFFHLGLDWKIYFMKTELTYVSGDMNILTKGCGQCMTVLFTMVPT